MEKKLRKPYTRKPKPPVVEEKPEEKLENTTPISSEDTFSITVTMNGEVFHGEGPTPLEALESLSMPPKIVAKAFLLIEHGDAKKEMLMLPYQLKRLFWPNTRTVVAKTLAMGLK